MRILLLTLFLAACSSSSSGGGNNGTDGTDGADGQLGDTQNATSDTPAGDSDATSTEDVGPPPTKCTGPSDCDAGEVCDCQGICVPGGIEGYPNCVEDKNCGSDAYCDVCAGVCRVPRGLCEPCTTPPVSISGAPPASECADNGVCTDFASGGRFCLKQCVTDAGCPPAFKCLTGEGFEGKQCQPVTGACSLAGECAKDTDCDFGQVCNEKVCRPGCADDTACPNGNVCSAFRCVPACSDSNPCEGELICDEGHCKVEGGCLQPQDCAEPETYCDMKTMLCTPGCEQDFDCKASKKECKGGKCVDKGCPGNYFCGFEQVCDLGSGLCEKAVGPYCEPDCNPDDESACGGAPNKCLKLQDKDGNDLGAFCFVACLNQELNRCPQGYGCQELKDDQGAVQAELCFRDCTTKPLGAE